MAYSTILQFRTLVSWSQSAMTASNGHAPMHLPHPTQLSAFRMAFFPSILIASWAQFLMQTPHPLQASPSMTGLFAACMSTFPLRDAHPMARFFNAPPNPVSSWHLKWLSVTRTSESTMVRPIIAFFTYSPSMGTSTSSVPFSPSAMIIWHPVDMGLNPFRFAVSRCSTACFLFPTYMVLVSVRNGMPPFSFTRSPTTLA